MGSKATEVPMHRRDREMPHRLLIPLLFSYLLFLFIMIRLWYYYMKPFNSYDYRESERGSSELFEIYLTSCLIVCNCRFIRIRGFRLSDKVGFRFFILSFFVIRDKFSTFVTTL